MSRNPWRITLHVDGTPREVTLKAIAGELLQHAYTVAITQPIFSQPASVYRSRLLTPLVPYVHDPLFPEHWRTRLETLIDELAEEIAGKSSAGIQDLGWVVLKKSRDYDYTVVRTTAIRLSLKWMPPGGLFRYETISQSQAAALLSGPFDYYYEENQSAQFFELCRRLKLTGRIMFRRQMRYTTGDYILCADAVDSDKQGRDLSFTFRKVTYLGK